MQRLPSASRPAGHTQPEMHVLLTYRAQQQFTEHVIRLLLYIHVEYSTAVMNQCLSLTQSESSVWQLF